MPQTIDGVTAPAGGFRCGFLKCRSELEAANAYNKFAIENFGEFAYLNQI